MFKNTSYSLYHANSFNGTYPKMLCDHLQIQQRKQIIVSDSNKGGGAKLKWTNYLSN